MIGGDALFPALLLYLACVAGALLAVPLLIFGAISILRSHLKRGIILFGSASLLASPFVGFWLFGSHSKNREITIEKDLSLPTHGFDRSARIRTLDDGRVSHQLWGEIHLVLGIPGGGKLIGDADRITIVTDTDGYLDALQVYYEPSLPSEMGNTIDDAFNYWEKFGNVTTRFKHGRFRVIKMNKYTLILDELNGAIRFDLKRTRD